MQLVGVLKDNQHWMNFSNMTDEELKDFMEYFKNELPNPEHYPLKVMWLMKWYKSIVLRNRENEDTARLSN